MFCLELYAKIYSQSLKVYFTNLLETHCHLLAELSLNPAYNFCQRVTIYSTDEQPVHTNP